MYALKWGIQSLAFTSVATADNYNSFVDYCGTVVDTPKFSGDTGSLSAKLLRRTLRFVVIASPSCRRVTSAFDNNIHYQS